MSDKLSYLAKYGGDFSTTETTSKKKKKKDKKKKSKKRNDETNTNTSTTLVRDLDDDDAAFHHDETNDDDLGEEGPIICLPDGTTSSSIDYKTLQSKSKQQHAPKSGFVPVKDENENENENVNNTRKDRRMKRYDSEEEEQNNSMDCSPPRNRRRKQRHDSEDEDQNSAHKSPPRNRQRKRYDSEEDDDDDDDKYERGNNYNRSSPPRNRQRKRQDSEDDDDNSDIDSRRRQRERQRERQRKSRKEKESMSSPRKKYRTRHDTDSEENDTHGHRDHHRHHRRRHRRSPSHSRSRSRSSSPVRQHPRRQQRHDSSSEEEEDNDQHIGGKDMSNAIASTTYRDSKTGQKMDMKRQYQDVLSEHRKEQLKAIELNKGKAQKEQEQQMKQIQNFVKAQPFARTEDDLDFETGKKHEIRAEDPMAMQAMKRQQQNSNGKSSKPTYKGPAPKPNRFNIKPGYRWDGVDRGNGFEDKVLALTYSQAQRKENAYKWSTADM